MRLIFSLISMLIFSFSIAQNFTYPLIVNKGEKLIDFVPDGWIILDSAKGDLNKDGVGDIALIIQHKDSITQIKLGDTLITQPRILIITFKNIPDNNFYTAVQNNTFILNHDNSAMDDPYSELTIDRGVLKIDFRIFYNMGSWYITNATYKFRYKNAHFELIGADLSSFHRASHEYENYSYNFLTGKRISTKGNERKNTKKSMTTSINILPLKTFETFVQPFSWEVESDIYL